jgi:hypothetical protein
MKSLVSDTAVYDTGYMGYALWVDETTAWAQGTHEYKPMGVAVIAATDQFRARDFRRSRRPPSRRLKTYAGLFASLEDANRYLARRRSQISQKFFERTDRTVPPYV